MIRIITTRELTLLRNQLSVATRTIVDLTDHVRSLQRRNAMLVNRISELEGRRGEINDDTLPSEVDPK